MKLLDQVVDALKGKAPLTAARSSYWPKVRKEHLSKHPQCAVCGETHKLEVHHIQPFHLHPELELNPDNLITLCESDSNGVCCHLFVGHLGNYKSFNTSVKDDAKYWHNKLQQRPKKEEEEK